MRPDFLIDRFSNSDVKLNYLVGEDAPPKPPMIPFLNRDVAIEMINKHLENRGVITLHADVDTDGIGEAYIVQSFLNDLGCVGRVRPCINKEKEHGMFNKHIPYVNERVQSDLVIIVDSSSNDLDIIKQFNCDVIVIDHHIIGHTEYVGDTAGGKYVIINNMIDNLTENYKADRHMSGALVAYELFRWYEQRYLEYSILEKRMLYQWVGVTLLSDAISTGNMRNIWYMYKTVHNTETEPTLNRMLRNLTKFEPFLSKSFIQYTLAPTFNKAIRAGESAKALAIALGYPDRINELKVFDEYQKQIEEKALANIDNSLSISFRDISVEGISKSYAGLIATKIVDTYKKSAIAYIDRGEYLDGSFRGLFGDIDYRKIVESMGFFAEGHEAAFGIKFPRERMSDIEKAISDAESNYRYKPYVTMGNIDASLTGEHQIEDFDQFRKDGWLWKLGMANSVLSTAEQVAILVPTSMLELVKSSTKYYLYKLYTLECMSFDELDTQYTNIYIEYGSSLKAFARKERNLG